MKKILFILSCFLFVYANAQTTIDNQYYNRSRSSNIWDRVVGDSILASPSVKATKGKIKGSIVYNQYLKTLEVYDSITARWYLLSPSLILDGIINGGNVSWTGSGLSFYISAANYVIGGNLYHSNDTTITLPASDPTNPRIDLLVLNSAGVDTLIGTPAADPAQPQITPGTELELTSVLINAGATIPSGVTQTVIWDENTESTVTSSLTVNAANTSNPYHLTKAIDLSSHGSGGNIVFTLPSTIDLTAQSVFVMYIRLKAAYVSTTNISVSFAKDAGFFYQDVSNNLTFGTGQFGYTRTTANAYQVIQIPMSAFTFLSSPSTVKQVTISLSGAGGGMYLDYIQVQSGVSVYSAGVNSFNSRTGNVLPEKADYSQWFMDSTYRRNDSVFGIKNGVSYFQFKDSTGAGTSYTASEGVKLTGSNFTAGGYFSADSISFISRNNKVFGAKSVLNSDVTRYGSFYTTYQGVNANANNGSASTNLDLQPSTATLQNVTGTGTTSNVTVTNTYGRLVFQDNNSFTGSGIYALTDSTFIGNSVTEVPFVTFRPDSTVHYVKSVYKAYDSSTYTDNTLIPKKYLNQRLSSFSGGSGGNLINGFTNLAGSGVAMVKDTSGNKINHKRLKGGYRISVTDMTDSVQVSLDSTTQTLTDGATITFDASLGVSAKVTLGGNRTLAFTNFSAGTYLTLVVIQDGTGSRTLTLPTCKVINGGAGAVTLTTAANSEDILTFFKIGTTIYCNYGKNYN